MGGMVGAMAGVALAVGVHIVFSTWPGLAAGWPGLVLVWIARPGVRLAEAAVRHPFQQELGMIAAWLSLQLTLVLGAAALGVAVGLARAPEARRGAPREGAS